VTGTPTVRSAGVAVQRHLWPIRRREPVRVQAVESDPNVDALADLLDD